MTEPSRTRPELVGHKGAADLAPGNTLAAFDAALACGVDMIELDVLAEHLDGSGRLLVAHDHEDARGRVPLTFEQALEHLAGPVFAGVRLDGDVKFPGYELRVVESLRARGLVERTLLSGMFPASLARIRAAEPALRLGWSVRLCSPVAAMRSWLTGAWSLERWCGRWPTVAASCTSGRWTTPRRSPG